MSASKRWSTREGGENDQSVFATEQGVAISLFRRPINVNGQVSIEHSELWGSREAKLSQLDNNRHSNWSTTSLLPSAPFYFFVPRDDRTRDEYERGFKITEIMPIHSTAAVTARDSFVVAIDREELIAQIKDFRDLSVPDDVIRDRYFQNTRSEKYPAGDTRGWKLSQARRLVAADTNWRDHIRACLYRPYDHRFIYWSPTMIDWPRTEVMHHLTAGPNVALIARRQTPAMPTPNFFFVSDTIVLDGVIRSDNRGSESFFPLYLYDGKSHNDELFPSTRVNLSSTFIEDLCAATNADYEDHEQPQQSQSISARDVLHYIYAIFHSLSYRHRYASWLCVDFPRVFLPKNPQLFQSLVELGGRLVNQHLLRYPFAHTLCEPHGENPPLIDRGYPKLNQGNVYVNADCWIGSIDENVWSYRVGSYEVCRKWLKDRRGRTLSKSEFARYVRITRAVSETAGLMEKIDCTIDEHGGWPEAFV